MNGVFSGQSGTAFNVISNGASVNSPGNTQTADQVKSTVEKPGLIGPGKSWFGPYAFMPVTTARFGSTARNLMRGPGLVNLDASVFRDFRLSEGWTMQFRAEAFNVTNTPAFNNPNADASAPVRAVDGTITNLNNFSAITAAQATERQFRFALKFLF